MSLSVSIVSKFVAKRHFRPFFTGFCATARDRQKRDGYSSSSSSNQTGGILDAIGQLRAKRPLRDFGSFWESAVGNAESECRTEGEVRMQKRMGTLLYRVDITFLSNAALRVFSYLSLYLPLTSIPYRREPNL